MIKFGFLGVAACLVHWAAALQESSMRSTLLQSPDTPLDDTSSGENAQALMAAARDFDEEDDYDTWMWAHSLHHDMTGPESFRTNASEQEEFNVASAKRSCNILMTSRSSRENGVITFLVTRPMDLIRMTESLPRLWYYFLRRWPYPVKVFVPSESLRQYDPDSYRGSPTYQEVNDRLRREGRLPDNYDFEVVTFDLKFPEVIEKTNGTWTEHMNGCAEAVGTSYKHMNQFFTKVMYEHPSLEKYHYYLRLDADFTFLATLKEDPFCMMRQTGRKFIWQTRKWIHDPRCADGMFDFFQKWAKQNNLVGQDPKFWNVRSQKLNYVGYAGMGDLNFFRSEPVRRLAQAFNEDGRVYLNRWSDQTYYVLLFALFASHDKVGDIGFDWSEKAACHKCALTYNPLPPGDWRR